MSYDDFIEEYILPNEDRETREGYYKGNVGFDDDYVKEIAEHNKIDIKDFEMPTIDYHGEFYAKGGTIIHKSDKYDSEYWVDNDGDLFYRPIQTDGSVEEWSEVNERGFDEKERKEFDKEMKKLFGKKINFAKGGEVDIYEGNPSPYGLNPYDYEYGVSIIHEADDTYSILDYKGEVRDEGFADENSARDFVKDNGLKLYLKGGKITIDKEKYEYLKEVNKNCNEALNSIAKKGYAKGGVIDGNTIVALDSIGTALDVKNGYMFPMYADGKTFDDYAMFHIYQSPRNDEILEKISDKDKVVYLKTLENWK
jgi:hypothetical protein